MNLNTSLHKVIMRRVFYAYGIRVVLSPLFIYGAIFSVGLLLLARTVHVARVWENFVSQPVGQVPHFMVSTLSHGEVLTLLSLAFLVVSSVMITRALWSMRFFILHRRQWL